MKGQAIVFEERDKVTFSNVDVPEPESGEVLVRALVSLVSTGTETRILRGGQPGVEFPCVPGYSTVGVVEKAGDTDLLKPTDLVFVPHGKAPAGLHSGWGTHAERLVAPAGSLIPLDDCRRPEEYVFSNVAAVALHGAGRTFSQPGDRIVVVGLGLIGQLHLRIQKAMGREVIGVDILPWRLEHAVAGGAVATVNASECDVEEAVRDVWPEGAQVAVEATGRQEGLDACAAVLRSRARTPEARPPVLLIQSSLMGAVTVDARQAFVKDYMLVNSRSTDPHDLPQAVEMIGEGAFEVGDLITLQIGAERAEYGYNELLSHPEQHLTCVFEWD